MYVHMCDDGTLMLDETIRRCGVGQYCAGWDRIEAEWYMEKDVGLRKVEIREGAQHLGFAVAQQEGTNCLLYPHVYDLRENSVLCLCIKKERNAQIAMEMDGAEAGQLILDQPLPAYTCVSVPLRHSAGEHTLCLRLTGAISLDWFAFC